MVPDINHEVLLRVFSHGIGSLIGVDSLILANKMRFVYEASVGAQLRSAANLARPVQFRSGKRRSLVQCSLRQTEQLGERHTNFLRIRILMHCPWSGSVKRIGPVENNRADLSSI